ncbi:MAG: phosphodiester glycosidase family protein, partial [Muribaculaceae bacterium]|nr:phosphodiester glycosidase family protein [Muribaculaceae bacterium]
MRKFLVPLLAIACSVTATAATTWNLGGSNFTVDTIYHATVGPGITQTQLKVWNSSYSNNLIYTTIDLTTPNLELRGVQAKDNGDVVENVRSMGDRKNGLGKGQYITGTNADFFNMGGSPTRTCGTSLIDGHIYNIGYENDGWSSYAVVTGKKDITFSESVSVGYNATTSTGKTHKLWYNAGRATNYLCLYSTAYGKTTGTNGWGSECAVKLVSGNINSGNAVFEVTSTPIGNQGGTAAEGNMTIPTGGYVLSGVNDAFSYVKSLKIGDRISVSLTATVDGKEIVPSQIVGGCPVIVQNGQIAPASHFTRIDHFSSRQARTAIGYNKDKTKLVMLVDDKFTKNSDSSKPQFGASAGLTMKMLAYVMQRLDCYNAMAFDGGGSSQLYVKGLGICNVPYGSTALRAVANGFFAVSTTPVDNTVAKIEVVQKNVKLSTGGKITLKVYGYNKYGVMVNTNLTGFKVTLSSKVGSVSGSTITAGSGKYSTRAIVTYGSARYEMPLIVNGGGTFVSSEPEVEQPKSNLTLSEMWSRIDSSLDDGWDATAPDWTSVSDIKAKPCPRFATAWNGKIYTVNMKTMSIMEVDGNGQRDVYKLPALTGSINGVADHYGTAITHDDAGNFLVGHYFTKDMSSYVWTIYSPSTGKSKHVTLSLPTGYTPGRIDCIGRVEGDLTRSAVVHIAPSGTNTKVLNVTFKGNGDVDGVTATCTTTAVAKPLASATAVCQPTGSGAFAYYSKSASASALYNVSGTNVSANKASWTNYASTGGFETFVLDGKRYYVVNYLKTANANNTSPIDIAVIDENGAIHATWSNPAYKSTYGYSSIAVQQVNSKNVDIYIYNCTYRLADKNNGAIAVAKLRLSADGNTGYPDSSSIKFNQQWYVVDSSLNDGWDATAPDWSSLTSVKAKECPRFATALNGKIYTVNMKTMSIMEIDGNGRRDVYKLPSLPGSINGVADYYGTAITHDDAGNFLIGHYFTKDMSSYVWTVYSPSTGKAKHITLALPSGYTPGRVDCVGRVEGDLTRNAVFHVAPSGVNTKVLTVTFSGNGDVDGVTATCKTTTVAKPLSSNTAICQPVGSGAFAYYSKTTTATALYNVSGTTVSANKAAAWKNYAGTGGFETFVLDGKRYYVVNYLSAANNSNTSPMDVAVLDENGNVLANWKNANYTSCYGYSSIAVELINDVSVNIFVYNCTLKLGEGSGAVAAAKLKFSIGDDPQPSIREGFVMTPLWSTLDTSLNDGWDANAPVWSAAAIKAKECPRFATGRDGKLYSVNMKTMSIMEFDAEGHRDVCKLPALTGSINGVADYYGTAISRDDAGNFLIGHYFTKEMSAYVWTVYNPSTGEAKHITLPMPTGAKSGRIDCVGRVEGDLTRSARVYIAPATTSDKKVCVVTFEGDGNVGSVTADVEFSPVVNPLAA